MVEWISKWSLAELSLSSTAIVVVLMVLAEWIHGRRCRRIARLAFGPNERPAVWARLAPALRVIACGLIGWGLMVLLLLDPKVHSSANVDPEKLKNIILVVDVSPSMYLKDAGADKKDERRHRAWEVIESMFNRMPMREYRISVVAFYNGAKPLLKQSEDFEVVRHLLEDLPTYIGFEPGKTDLFAGLKMASEMSRDWIPGSTTVVVLTDGVTVPATGMPRLGNAVANILVVGVGDPVAGKFIDGHQSRQDTSNLRQIANRLGGIYHDGNIKHIPSSTIKGIVGTGGKEDWFDFSLRELALAAVVLGGFLLALLPLGLNYFGTSWNPGVKSWSQGPRSEAGRGRMLDQTMEVGR